MGIAQTSNQTAAQPLDSTQAPASSPPTTGTQLPPPSLVLTQKQKDSVAMNLAPIPGKAIVYIIRPSIEAFAIMMRLDVDSFQVGWIGIKSYLYTILDPGQHVFVARSENESDLTVTLEAGKVYFFEQGTRMGFAYAGVKLSPLTEEKGRKYLRKCGLSKSNRYPNMPLSKDVEREPPGSTGN
jgi:hypothetical protein